VFAVYPILRGNKDPELVPQVPNCEPELLMVNEPTSGIGPRVQRAAYGTDREEECSLSARLSLRMKPVRPKGRRKRDEDGFRDPAFPLRTRETSRFEASVKAVKMFTVLQYMHTHHPGYWESLPEYLRYLFAKFAYHQGAMTKHAIVKGYGNIPVPHTFRQRNEDGSVEPADMVYLSQFLCYAFREEDEENFYELLYKIDPEYANSQLERLIEMLVPTDQFLFEMVPRMRSRAAVQLYEEHLPDWFKIVRGFNEMIVEFLRHVQFVSPIQKFKRKVVLDIAERVVTLAAGRNTETAAEAAAVAGTSTSTSNDPEVVEVLDGENGGEKDEEPATNSRYLCAVCLTAERNTLFIPCKHCVCCAQCANRWLNDPQFGDRPAVCPFCREDVINSIDFYLP
jgi:hypothetical protein